MQRFATHAGDARVMTDAEAQEVLRRYLESPSGPNGVSTAALAEAMQVQESDIEEVLLQVRSTKGQRHADPNAKFMRRAKRRDILLAFFAIAFIISAGTAISLGARLARSAPWSTTAWAQSSNAVYIYQVGRVSRSISTRVPPIAAATSTNLLEVLSQDVEQALVQNTRATAGATTALAGPGTIPFELNIGPATVRADLPADDPNNGELRNRRRVLIARALADLQRRAELASGIESVTVSQPPPPTNAPPPSG
jgi:hypothetical protein